MCAPTRVWLSLSLCILLLFAQRVAALFPATLRPAGPDLRSRGLDHDLTELLRPRHEVVLPYADQTGSVAPFVVQVTTTHQSRPYVLLENFEHRLSSIRCSNGTAPGQPSSIVMTFDRGEDLALARALWNHTDGLIFMTHHRSCNDDVERGVYWVSSFEYDEAASAVILHGQRTDIGPEGEASTSIRFQGGPASEEIESRLQLRERWGIQPRETFARVVPIPFDERWPGREKLRSTPALDINVIDLYFTGELTLSFDIIIGDQDPSTWLRAITSGLTPEYIKTHMVKKMELTVEVTRAFEFDTIFDISAQGAVKFGYPGLKPSVDNVVHFSERIRPKRTISSINIGPFQFDITPRIGWGFSADFEGGIKFTYPVHASCALGEKATADLAGGRSPQFDIRPTVNKGPVQVTDWDASACGSVGYGPGLELKFIIHTNKAVESEVQIVTTAELSFFKLETCVGKVNDVNEACTNGPMTTALREQTTFQTGLTLKGEVRASVPDNLIPRFEYFDSDEVWPFLQSTQTLDSRCFDFGLNKIASKPKVSADGFAGVRPSNSLLGSDQAMAQVPRRNDSPNAFEGPPATASSPPRRPSLRDRPSKRPSLIPAHRPRPDPRWSINRR